MIIMKDHQLQKENKDLSLLVSQATKTMRLRAKEDRLRVEER
jgi:hypothetical protein